MTFARSGACSFLAFALFGLVAAGCGSSSDATSHGAAGDSGADSGNDAGGDSGVPNNDWPTFARTPERLFFAEGETSITADNAAKLKAKWTFKVGAALSASPVVVHLDLPEGKVPVVFVQSWDLTMYAIRLTDGSELWHFVTTDQPGANFPDTGSAHYEVIDGKPELFFANGEIMYCVDALTGKEIWRFYAGTGCTGGDGGTGLCGFNGERNEIESSPIIADGNVLFGMDVNDLELGKGGFYAVDARTGKLSWFFDVVSGKTCTPQAGDDVTHFDGYHSASELGLASDYFTTRTGCDFDRTKNGCGNVWASAAIDTGRSMLFFTTGNCDVDNDPATTRPAPPGPLADDAIVALHFDGSEAWTWRPRMTCADGTFTCINADLDFGSVPNLFSITLPGQSTPVDVVGAGDKSGTYYVIDRTGVNAKTAVKWNDADATQLPYWRRNVVDGGPAGGIIATAAVDAATRRVFFSTAPGDNPLQPQTPTQHALNADDGSIVWENASETPAEASFAPATATPNLVFAGGMFGAFRAYDAKTGKRVAKIGGTGSPIASGIVVFDGFVLVGQGIGQRGPDPTDQADKQWRMPSQLTAYCVPGSPGC